MLAKNSAALVGPAGVSLPIGVALIPGVPTLVAAVVWIALTFVVSGFMLTQYNLTVPMDWESLKHDLKPFPSSWGKATPIFSQ
jgi:hypothetical protein